MYYKFKKMPISELLKYQIFSILYRYLLMDHLQYRKNIIQISLKYQDTLNCSDILAIFVFKISSLLVKNHCHIGYRYVYDS